MRKMLKNEVKNSKFSLGLEEDKEKENYEL